MNSVPFRQLKSFLKILIGVQYYSSIFQNSTQAVFRRALRKQKNGEIYR